MCHLVRYLVCICDSCVSAGAVNARQWSLGTTHYQWALMDELTYCGLLVTIAVSNVVLKCVLLYIDLLCVYVYWLLCHIYVSAGALVPVSTWLLVATSQRSAMVARHYSVRVSTRGWTHLLWTTGKYCNKIALLGLIASLIDQSTRSCLL